jgi:hypothetical protein
LTLHPKTRSAFLGADLGAIGFAGKH